MKAGTSLSGYWATPAPGTKTEFEADSVEEKFVPRPMHADGLRPHTDKVSAGIRIEFGRPKIKTLK